MPIGLFANWGISTSNSTDGPVNLGTKFTVTASTIIRKLRYWKADASNDGQAITMTLWDAGTTVLGQVTRTQLAGDPVGWVELTLSSAVTVTTGIEYTVSWRAATGTIYTVSSDYPVANIQKNGPIQTTANFAVYAYGALAKPTGAGGYSYSIDIVADGVEANAVKAFDTDQTPSGQQWFNDRFAEGHRLYVPAGTNWGTSDPATGLETRLGMALNAGLKIGLYTRDPRNYAVGIAAAGIYKSRLEFFALDVETDPGIPVTRAMVNGVIALGVRPIIYTGSAMWATIQGATANDFSDIPLWDTDPTATVDGTYSPSLLSPPPVQYGGWNTPTNMRVGVQQRFELPVAGTNVDLNTWDSSFFATTGAVTVVNTMTAVLAAGTSDVIPLGFTTKPGNTLVVCTTARSTSATIAYSGVTYTGPTAQIVGSSGASARSHLTYFHKAASTTSITVTSSASVAKVVTIMEVAGAAVAPRISTTATRAATTAPVSPSGTSKLAGELYISVIGHATSAGAVYATAGPTNSWTSRANIGNSGGAAYVGHGVATFTQATSGVSPTTSWTTVSAAQGAATISFAPAIRKLDLGAGIVSKLYVGDGVADAAYLGNNLVYKA